MYYKYKIVEQGQKTIKELRKGIDKVAKIVGSTIGPCGRNKIIEYKGRSYPTNDGVTIAKHIIFEDEIENLGAQLIIEAAMKTNDMVGDGTTTAIILTKAIIDEVMDKIEKNINPLDENATDVFKFRKEIENACKEVVEELKKIAKPIEAREDLEKVAMVSMQDEDMGKTIADIVHRTGANGFVTVEQSYKYETEHEVVKGMKLDATYVAPHFVTRRARREAVWENAPILVTSNTVESLENLRRINEIVTKQMKKQAFIIMATKFDRAIIPALIAVTLRTTTKILPIKAPALTPEQLEDVAAYTGAVFIDADKDMGMDKITKEDFGKTTKVVADRDFTIIMGGGGKKEDVEKRINDLKEQVHLEKRDMFKKKIERRVASLAAGVGIIKVGAKTDVERDYLKDKVDDAVHACQAAAQEGIVKGGGLALKEIAEKLPDSNILKKPLMVPWELIQKYAGGKLKIGKEIVDPVKVTRVALENACSAAKTFITSDGVVCENKHELEDTLRDVGFIKQKEEWAEDKQSNV